MDTDRKVTNEKKNHIENCKYHFINHNFTSEMHLRRKKINYAIGIILMENPILRKFELSFIFLLRIGRNQDSYFERYHCATVKKNMWHFCVT